MIRILLLLIIPALALGQSVFYDSISFESDITPEYTHSYIDTSASSVAFHNGNSHLRFPSSLKHVMFEGNLIYYVAAGYQGAAINEGFIISLDSEGNQNWVHKLASDEGQYYYLSEMEVVDDQILLKLFVSESTSVGSAFSFGDVSSIQLRSLSAETGEEQTATDFTNRQYQIRYNANNFKFDEEGLMMMQYLNDTLNLKHYDWNGIEDQNSTFTFEDNNGTITSKYAILGRQGIMVYRSFLRDDVRDVYLYFLPYGSTEFERYSVSDMLSMEDQYVVNLHDDFFEVFTFPEANFNGYNQKNITVFDLDGNYVSLSPDENLTSCYQDSEIHYSNSLDRWIYVGAKTIPNVIDIYEVSENGSMSLLLQLDIEQFDHLLNLVEVSSTSSGDLLIAASQTRYPYYDFLLDDLHFPVLLNISNEQLGVDVSTEELIHDQNSTSLIQPNPVKDYFEVVFGDGQSKEILVYDLLGKLIFSEIVDSHQMIHVDNWESGMYFVLISGENKAVKIVKP